MRGQEMLDLMNDLDPAYIEAAAQKPHKAGWLRWAALAACICFVVAGAGALGFFGSQGKIPEGGLVPGDTQHEGIDSVIANVAVHPAHEDLRDVADAVSVSITEEDARLVPKLGAFLPTALPEDCRYVVGAHYRTMMKDGTEYQMLRVTYEGGHGTSPDPLPENAGHASDTEGSTAFVWMVWGHLPDDDYPVFQPEEVSASFIEKQDGNIFYIDYGGIYVGIEQLEISAEDMFAAIHSIG